MPFTLCILSGQNPKHKTKESQSLDPGLGFLLLFLKYCTCIDILKEEPKIIDLLKIFDGCEHDYKLIGDSLEVTVNDIKYDPTAPKDSLRLVFQRWRKNNNDVTWRRIKQVCEDFPKEFGKVKPCFEEYFHQRRLVRNT